MEYVAEKSENYFDVNLKILKIFGMSLKGKTTLMYKIYSMLILSVILASPLLSVPDMFINGYDDLIRTIFIDFAFLVSLIKVFTLYVNRKKFSKLVERLETKPFQADIERGGLNERALIQEYSVINRNQTRIYWSTVFPYLAVCIMLGVIRRMSSSNYEDWSSLNFKYVVVNITYSPNYEFSFAHQYLSWLAFAVFFMTSDLLLAGVLCNINYQFKMLQNCIRTIPLRASKSFAMNAGFVHSNTQDESTISVLELDIPWVQLKYFVKTAVDYHMDIIYLMKEVEGVFSISLMLVFVSTMAMAGASMYIMSTRLVTDDDFWARFMEGCYVLFQLFLVCYWSERVKNESFNVGKATWDVSVVFPNLRFQQAMSMVTIRSQIPMQFTAGKFTNIGLATMTWMMRASYSTFMLLRNVRLK